jgi:hypothetical protein
MVRHLLINKYSKNGVENEGKARYNQKDIAQVFPFFVFILYNCPVRNKVLKRDKQKRTETRTPIVRMIKIIMNYNLEY